VSYGPIHDHHTSSFRAAKPAERRQRENTPLDEGIFFDTFRPWPLVGSLGGGLWEVRSSLGDRIARTFFIIVHEEIILLHGIIKKSRTAPKQELDLARKRQALYLK